MSGSKRVAVILSGCGVYDGAEIHEATLSLLALELAGATAVIAAPDIPQARVQDHATGQPIAGQTRNVLSEAARIARGAIRPVGDLRVDEIDAVLMPGGYGAALNLSNLASAGVSMEVEPATRAFLEAAHRSGKPLAAICIAPPILAKVLAGLGVTGARLTIGNDPGTAAVIEALGQVHVECPPSSCVVDPANRVVTSPAYMLAGGIAELWTGVQATVEALLRL